jgi:phosphoribosyl-AMP cyclohydrolase / phosphoribosyl-ATP pyrophosphohydrolase
MNRRDQSAEAWIGDIRWDERGLVPAIVQDDISKEVLMLAYMNESSLRKSLETGETWFWSRSRGELWHKGATSGHTQRIVSIRYDCDSDALLVRVRQNGPACHTGSYSCFSREAPTDGGQASVPAGEGTSGGTTPDRFGPLNRLEATIARRHAERPEGTYTTYLFAKGLDKILKKIGEETAEVIIAAKNRDNSELRCETADLLYHLMVLLRERELPLDDVLAELDRRHRPDQADRREPSDRPDKRRNGAGPAGGQEDERRAH